MTSPSVPTIAQLPNIEAKVHHSLFAQGLFLPLSGPQAV